MKIPLKIMTNTLIGITQDSGGAVTKVERSGDTLVVTRSEDVTEALIEAANDRANEVRQRIRDDSMNSYKLAELPLTVVMEIGKVHGVWYGMAPEVSGCATKAELFKKFCKVLENHYPLFKSTNRKLA